jgi:hypothetical protein
VVGAVKFVPDFGIGAPFLDDLADNLALCGHERARGVLLGDCQLLGGRRLALEPLLDKRAIQLCRDRRTLCVTPPLAALRHLGHSQVVLQRC